MTCDMRTSVDEGLMAQIRAAAHNVKVADPCDIEEADGYTWLYVTIAVSQTLSPPVYVEGLTAPVGRLCDIMRARLTHLTGSAWFTLKLAKYGQKKVTIDLDLCRFQLGDTDAGRTNESGSDHDDSSKPGDGAPSNDYSIDTLTREVNNLGISKVESEVKIKLEK
ncbi:hypothetical protein CXG81DRAFT_20770 [Caulochytrium protostelioides]|uniref:Uncharacterized protein n=1 Tax=Caulochytrium protostelioides TaxID=1555241 RepID=A0A4P9X1N1_9FUNG|nr:hypothetical protein CXG81DRAFT_20770 [Caulochytrium protostelioides]|eukprot:RKO99112.1 hypothetical protein CXG81DRAFT_20770 [Caulochytrium protostelioides]